MSKKSLRSSDENRNRSMPSPGQSFCAALLVVGEPERPESLEQVHERLLLDAALGLAGPQPLGTSQDGAAQPLQRLLSARAQLRPLLRQDSGAQQLGEAGGQGREALLVQ